MKKKYIKIIAILVLILFLVICGPILITYKPSRLICVGQININGSVGYDLGYKYLDREDFESYLIMESESESPYFVLNQQEIDELVDAVNQYEDYLTVILSGRNSKVFWTRYKSPHIGYIDINWIIDDSVKSSDDVLYVYVTKCTEIDDIPWGMNY